MKFSSIIVAAGRGLRARSAANKVLIRAGDIPILYYSLKRFSALEECAQIILVVNQDDLKEGSFDKEKIMQEYRVEKIIKGGSRRMDSVRNGFEATDPGINTILIHDAARPFVSSETILSVARAADKWGAAIAAAPAGDTLKEVDNEMFVNKTISRKNIYCSQTPQAFSRDVLEKAYCTDFVNEITDEAELVESLGVKVRIVDSTTTNIKITTPEDLHLAKQLLPVWEKE